MTKEQKIDLFKRNYPRFVFDLEEELLEYGKFYIQAMEEHSGSFDAIKTEDDMKEMLLYCLIHKMTKQIDELKAEQGVLELKSVLTPPTP